jgi:hypothetical protein
MKVDWRQENKRLLPLAPRQIKYWPYRSAFNLNGWKSCHSFGSSRITTCHNRTFADGMEFMPQWEFLGTVMK